MVNGKLSFSAIDGYRNILRDCSRFVSQQLPKFQKVCLEIQLIEPKTKQSDRKLRQIYENAMASQYINLEIVPIPIEIEISISLKTPIFRDLEISRSRDGKP